MSRKRTHRHRRDDDGAEQARGGWKRRVWLGVSLAAVIALQIATIWGRLGAPFLDTRLHYSYDNADFGFIGPRSRSVYLNDSARSFGSTQLSVPIRSQENRSASSAAAQGSGRSRKPRLQPR